jgi:hypothetical protein
MVSPEKWGSYCYSVGREKAQISWGMLTSEAILCIVAPRDRSISLKATPQGDVLYMGDLPAGAATLKALVPAVDQAVTEMSRNPRHPGLIVFPGLKTRESHHEPATELGIAAESLLLILESERESLSVLYGYALPNLAPLFSEPSWGGHLSGIRLPNDPHFYHLRADLGRLEMIRYDPANGKELDRIDMRFCEKIHTSNHEIGDIQICRQTLDLEPFIQELRNLVQFLEDAAGKIVTIERVGIAGDESSNAV